MTRILSLPRVAAVSRAGRDQPQRLRLTGRMAFVGGVGLANALRLVLRTQPRSADGASH